MRIISGDTRGQITRSMAPATAGLLLLLLILAAMAAVSCSRAKPLPPLTRRVVVLDYKVAPAPSFQVKGWWFGARSHYQSTNEGVTFADVLARKLTQLEYIEQHSRADLKYYMGQKRQLLANKFKKMTNEEITKSLGEVSPIDYGSELQVDQVITGEVLSSYISQHRTIHAWRAHFHARIDVHDMGSGKVVWSREFSASSLFGSHLDAMEKAADKAVKALDRDFYQKQNKPL